MFKKIFGKKEKIKKILIVEDDAMLSKVLAESLKEDKTEIIVVENGLNVVDEARHFLPDIILLDLIIPGIDGFAVLKELKEETKTKNIPVVVVSNLSQESDVKAVKALGALKYFIKANSTMSDIIQYVKNIIKKYDKN